MKYSDSFQRTGQGSDNCILGKPVLYKLLIKKEVGLCGHTNVCTVLA
jgi:hypothetical protein